MTTAMTEEQRDETPAAFEVGTREAAARLGVTTARVRQLCIEGTLKGRKDDETDDWWVDVASIERRIALLEQIHAAKRLLKGGTRD